MINLEAAQALHDDAQKKLVGYHVPNEVRAAVDALGFLIAEHRGMRNDLRAVAKTMTYGESA